MLNVDVLLDTLSPGIPIDSRVDLAADAGFMAVETWKSDADSLRSIHSACLRRGSKLVSVVVNYPTDPKTAITSQENHAAFLERIDRVSDIALSVGCQSGVVCAGLAVHGKSFEGQKALVVEALRAAAETAERKKFSLNLEVLNTRRDHPGYFLDSSSVGFEIIRNVGSPALRMLFDIYHIQIMEGNLAETIRANLGLVGHFHAAAVPGRAEIFDGEVNYEFLARLIRDSAYEGYFGLEYNPSLPSVESLRRTAEFLASA